MTLEGSKMLLLTSVFVQLTLLKEEWQVLTRESAIWASLAEWKRWSQAPQRDMFMKSRPPCTLHRTDIQSEKHHLLKFTLQSDTQQSSHQSRFNSLTPVFKCAKNWRSARRKPRVRVLRPCATQPLNARRWTWCCSCGTALWVWRLNSTNSSRKSNTKSAQLSQTTRVWSTNCSHVPLGKPVNKLWWLTTHTHKSRGSMTQRAGMLKLRAIWRIRRSTCLWDTSSHLAAIKTSAD